MSGDSAVRPGRATMGGWLTIAGGVLVVLNAFQTIATLHSLDMRTSIESELSSPNGLSVDHAIDTVRVLAMVAAVGAVVAAGLGVQALRRSRRARLGLSVLSAPFLVVVLMLATLVNGSVLGALVAVGTVMLWTGPARDWFAGRPVIAASDDRRSASGAGWKPGSGPGSDEPTRPSVEDIWGSTSSPVPPPEDPPPAADQRVTGEQPPPSYGYGTAPARPAPPPQTSVPAQPPQPAQPVAQPPQPPQWGQPGPAAWPSGPPPMPYGYSPYGQPVGRPGQMHPDARPPAVLVAAVVTWVFAGVTGLLALAGVLIISLADDHQVDVALQSQNRRLDVSTATFRSLVLLLGGLAAVICLLACVFAVMLLRRNNAGRIGLVLTGVLTIVLSAVSLPLSIFNLLATGLVLVLLLQPAVNAWLRPRPAAGPPGPPGPPVPRQQPPQQPQPPGPW